MICVTAFESCMYNFIFTWVDQKFLMKNYVFDIHTSSMHTQLIFTGLMMSCLLGSCFFRWWCNKNYQNNTFLKILFTLTFLSFFGIVICRYLTSLQPLYDSFNFTKFLHITETPSTPHALLYMMFVLFLL